MDEATKKVTLITAGSTTKIECRFDSVFPEVASQADVYQFIKPNVELIIGGYNTTVLAYGQTGTGKTYTMLGGASERLARDVSLLDASVPSDWGIIPRLIADLFTRLEEGNRAQELSGFSVYCSYMQVSRSDGMCSELGRARVSLFFSAHFLSLRISHFPRLVCTSVRLDLQ